MPEGLEHTVPAASGPLPASSLEDQMAEVRGWILGYVKDNKQQPGMMSMLTELYEDARLRKERREAYSRALTTGGVLAILGVTFSWLKDHIKF